MRYIFGKMLLRYGLRIRHELSFRLAKDPNLINGRIEQKAQSFNRCLQYE
jgi:hypothetical protein